MSMGVGKEEDISKGMCRKGGLQKKLKYIEACKCECDCDCVLNQVY